MEVTMQTPGNRLARRSVTQEKTGCAALGTQRIPKGFTGSVKRKRDDQEHREQCAFMSWLQWKHPSVYEMTAAVPNGGFRGKATAGKLKAEGVKAGFPDILICYPVGDYHGLVIEMKATGRTSSAVSSEQKGWIGRLSACGYRAEVAFGLDQAKGIVEEYLNAKRNDFVTREINVMEHAAARVAAE